MLYYGNKKWTKSIESLFKSKGFINTEAIPKIQKILNKGDNVYVTFNPYASEIESEMRAMWNTSLDTLNSISDELADDI